MLQGVFIDLCLLRVNGGILTDDGAVQRADIRAYLPIALNFATTKFYYSNKTQELSRDFPSWFYTEYDGLIIDRTGSVPKITLPKIALQMPSNQGIRRIMDDCGNTFTPIQDGEASMINYYASSMPNLRMYLPIGLQTIFLYNVTKLAQHVNALIIIDPTQFDDATNLPISAGLEQDVLDLMVAHFTAQRQQPGDVIADTKDLNSN